MAARRPRTPNTTDDGVTVALCAGKDCRKQCEFAKIRDELNAAATVIELDCVGICSGPVVVTDVMTKRPAVYAKLRTKSQRRHLLDVVVDGARPAKDLRKRQVTGSKTKKTLRKLERVRS